VGRPATKLVKARERNHHLTLPTSLRFDGPLPLPRFAAERGNYFAYVTGIAVVYLIVSMAKLELTSDRVTRWIRRL
jgi:hypothetical protein